MKEHIVKLKPYIAEYIWGGTSLKDFWNKKTDVKKVAEAWELSAYPGKESIIDSGVHKGLSLSKFIDKAPSFFGKKLNCFNIFPLLIKLINSKQALSIQVHPTDDYALVKEGQFGKTEVWYIAEAEENAFIYLGFNRDVTREEIKKNIENGTLLTILNKLKVEKGDFVEIPPGTVHALQEGLTILEVQQNSNVTYRIFDYNRVDDAGEKRELHLEKALDVLCTKKHKQKAINVIDLAKANFNCKDGISIQKQNNNVNDTLSSRAHDTNKGVPNLKEIEVSQDFLSLVENKYFHVFKGELRRETSMFCEDSFIAVTAIDGEGVFSTGDKIKKGETFLISANKGANLTNITKKLGVICVTLGDINV